MRPAPEDTRKLRIAHVATVYASAVTILEPKLATLDHYSDMEITSITAAPPTNSHFAACSVRHIAFPIERNIRPWRDFWATLALYKILRREGFDIVHTHTAKAGLIGAIAARLAGVPLVLHTAHGFPFYQGQPILRYYSYRWLEWFACRFRHALFSQNRSDLPVAKELMGSDMRVFLEGNGIDARAVQEAAKLHRGRAEDKFPPGSLRLVILSRLDPIKRLGDFLEMCELLARQDVNFCAVIAGRGPQKQKLQWAIDTKGLSDRVRLLGWVSHAAALMAAGDVVLLTSEKEGIPRSVMEAMALGKPVIATDVAGTQELVVNGSTGYLVPVGSPGKLAEKVRLLTDADLRQRFGKAGKKRVEEKFDDIRIAALLRDIYIKLFSGTTSVD